MDNLNWVLWQVDEAVGPDTYMASFDTMRESKHPTQNQLAMGGEAQDIIYYHAMWESM